MKNLLQKISAFVIVGIIFFAPMFLVKAVTYDTNGNIISQDNYVAPSLNPSDSFSPSIDYTSPTQSSSINPTTNINSSGPNQYSIPSSNSNGVNNNGTSNGFTPSYNAPAYTTTGVGSSNTGVGGNISLRNPVSAGSLTQLLDLAMKAFIDIGAIVGVLAIVYCGFLFVKAQGNEKGLEEARSAFYWTIIGLAILLSATVLENIIKNTINSLGVGTGTL